MVRASLVVIALFAASAAPVFAATKQPAASDRCASLNRGVANSVKMQALYRAAHSPADVAQYQGEMQNKIALMRASGCRPYQGQVSADAYALPATLCHTAILGVTADELTARRVGHEDPTDEAARQAKDAKCDMTTWKAAPVE